MGGIKHEKLVVYYCYTQIGKSGSTVKDWLFLEEIPVFLSLGLALQKSLPRAHEGSKKHGFCLPNQIVTLATYMQTNANKLRRALVESESIIPYIPS